MIAIAVTAAAVSILGLLVLREAWLGYPTPRPARVLNRKEQAFLHVCGDTFFPGGGPLPSSDEAGVVAYLDHTLVQLPRRQRVLIRLLFVFVEHGSLVFGPFRSRVTRQSLAQRLATFRDWEGSDSYFRRTAFLSLRTLMTMAYFAAPSVGQAVCGASA